MENCGGYTFRWVRQASGMDAPDRLRATGTPIILVAEADGWRVLRAQPTGDPAVVAVQGMEHALWQGIGGGGASLTLPGDIRERVLAKLSPALVGKTIQRPGGKRATILAVSPQGGVRIQPDQGEARNVSLTDICWVAVAEASRATGDGAVDEATVNRWRYLPGTPKPSTRWIDTGWAIGIWTNIAEQAEVGIAQSDTESP